MHNHIDDRRIHVLFLLVSQSVGGAEIHALSLANGLGERRFRASIVYLKNESDSPDFTCALREDITSFCVDVQKKIDVRAMCKLSDFVARESVDLIVCANPFPLLYASCLRLLCKRPLKIVEIFHSTEPFTRKATLQMLAFRPLFYMADLLVYVCNTQRNYWRRNLLWARKSRVVHNGVDVSRFRNDFSDEEIGEFRKAYGFTVNDYVVGICGKMRPEKAHCDLVEAVSRVRARGIDVKCLLIGDGPTRRSVEVSIARHALVPHVGITGIVDDVRLAIASCDVIAVPSRNETFSIAALESMALRKPVIMSDVGGAAELVRHAVNGYLFPKGDIEALSERIALLADHAKRHSLGMHAWHTVDKKFSAKIMVDTYAEIFSELAGKGSASPDACP